MPTPCLLCLIYCVNLTLTSPQQPEATLENSRENTYEYHMSKTKTSFVSLASLCPPLSREDKEEGP